MTKETLVIDKQEYMKLYALAVKMETFISYRDDDRSVMNQMAPSFLKDCEILVEEYNKLRKER